MTRWWISSGGFSVLVYSLSLQQYICVNVFLLLIFNCCSWFWGVSATGTHDQQAQHFHRHALLDGSWGDRVRTGLKRVLWYQEWYLVHWDYVSRDGWRYFTVYRTGLGVGGRSIIQYMGHERTFLSFCVRVLQFYKQNISSFICS